MGIIAFWILIAVLFFIYQSIKYEDFDPDVLMSSLIIFSFIGIIIGLISYNFVKFEEIPFQTIEYNLIEFQENQYLRINGNEVYYQTENEINHIDIHEIKIEYNYKENPKISINSYKAKTSIFSILSNSKTKTIKIFKIK